MTLHTSLSREASLDALNAMEMASEQVLIPWANLRDALDAEADLMRSRMAANQCAYFQDRDRANASGTAAFALRVEPASPSRPHRLQSTFAKEANRG